MLPDVPRHVAERGDPAFTAALARARSEYLEMPGLQLTRAQAARLWALDARTCEAVLDALVDTRFLMCTRDASFVRA
jgi:hypothetical protein